MVMDNYYGTNAVELTKASGPLSEHVGGGRATANYCSLVDTGWWLLMYSCPADIAYRTARPIFTKRGPVPFIRDLANHDNDTPRSLATCTGCSRGSSSLVFAGAPMATSFRAWRWTEDAFGSSAKRVLCYAKFLID